MVNYELRIKKFAKEAVIRCIEIMGLKNPDVLEETEKGYIHTNLRGRKRLFIPYTKNEYFEKHRNDITFRGKKYHKVLTYYIVEETI